jgi:YD repeat-containing protein
MIARERALVSIFACVLTPLANAAHRIDTTGVSGYDYDNLDRLTSAGYPGQTTTQYTYDGNGNRLSTQVDANPQVGYSPDAADQLASLGGVGNTYDGNGNLLLIGTGGLNTFLYDDANRLFRTGPCGGDVDGNGMAVSADAQFVYSAFQKQAAEGDTAYDVNIDLLPGGAMSASDAQAAFADFTTKRGSSAFLRKLGRLITRSHHTHELVEAALTPGATSGTDTSAG